MRIFLEGCLSLYWPMLLINEIKEPNLICTKDSLAGSHINEWDILD